MWEDILAEEEDIDAWCESFTEIPTPVDLPDIEELFEFGADEDPADFGYYLAVLSAYDDPQSEEDPADIELYWEPSVGDELEHADGQNFEVILCIAEFEDEPTPSPTVSVQPTVTGPVGRDRPRR